MDLIHTTSDADVQSEQRDFSFKPLDSMDSFESYQDEPTLRPARHTLLLVEDEDMSSEEEEEGSTLSSDKFFLLNKDKVDSIRKTRPLPQLPSRNKEGAGAFVDVKKPNRIAAQELFQMLSKHQSELEENGGDTSDEDAGTEFLRRIVLPHLGANNVTESQDADKCRMLLFMIRKLYALVEGECAIDNPDAVQNQEVLLGGHLYGMILKEKLDEWLNSLRLPLQEWGRKTQWKTFTSREFENDFVPKILRRTNENLGQAMEYFLSTGNLVSPTGLDLQQTAGFCVVAEKINFYRFISHFRMVHRGAFFAQLKTTTVRKLLPESWGFLCPVHTPDGSPCGLLNHLAHKCKLATHNVDVSAVPKLVSQLGVSGKSSASLDASVVVQ